MSDAHPELRTLVKCIAYIVRTIWLPEQYQAVMEWHLGIGDWKKVPICEKWTEKEKLWGRSLMTGHHFSRKKDDLMDKTKAIIHTKKCAMDKIPLDDKFMEEPAMDALDKFYTNSTNFYTIEQ